MNPINMNGTLWNILTTNKKATGKQLTESLLRLAEWYKRTGDIENYNKTNMRYKLNLEIAGYDTI